LSVTLMARQLSSRPFRTTCVSQNALCQQVADTQRFNVRFNPVDCRRTLRGRGRLQRSGSHTATLVRVGFAADGARRSTRRRAIGRFNETSSRNPRVFHGSLGASTTMA
jgi:hypothetical protein